MMDLRPYAERLAKAMPERFQVFPDDCVGWTLRRCGEGLVWELMFGGCAAPKDVWFYFGPLLEELEIAAVWRAPSHTSTLEAVAEAVCQAIEAKAKGEPA